MRRMNTRQAILTIISFWFLTGLPACSPSKNIVQAQAVTTPIATVPAALPTPTAIPATSTPLECLSAPGTIKQDVVSTTKPPQEFLIYLPPCYDSFTDERYPVLYLLHGQTYTDDQWVRIGAPAAADELIHSGESPRFIMVFPDDRYWNTEAGPGFGDRFINDLIPYTDKNYRTLADRDHRFLGGLSRGGGWTVKLGFAHPDLFGALGLHSPAVFKEDAPYVEQVIRSMPPELRPKLWIDIGDSDTELTRVMLMEEMLLNNDYLHQFQRFIGDHSEVYWNAHVVEYLRWYTSWWQEAAPAQ
jgi:enterochelin esterase-like enzyme